MKKKTFRVQQINPKNKMHIALNTSQKSHNLISHVKKYFKTKETNECEQLCQIPQMLDLSVN